MTCGIPIGGRPFSGIYSLMNALTGQYSAIVTHIPGTTREVLREQVELDGLPLHIVDTAGLREANDVVEKEGVRRARDELARADHALWVFDGERDPDAAGLADAGLPPELPITRIRNKADLVGIATGLDEREGHAEISLSAKTGAGVDVLREHLKNLVSFEGASEGDFSARRRHLDAIDAAEVHLELADENLHKTKAGELLAEELRFAQEALTSITGEFSSDDLLGRIFSDFCIGK